MSATEVSVTSMKCIGLFCGEFLIATGLGRSKKIAIRNANLAAVRLCESDPGILDRVTQATSGGKSL